MKYYRTLLNSKKKQYVFFTESKALLKYSGYIYGQLITLKYFSNSVCTLI